MVDRLQQEYGERIELDWRAFELRPDPAPLPVPAAINPQRLERWKKAVLPMAAERGLEMHPPPVSPRTRLAFQAVEFARDHDRFAAMHRAIFDAFFREGRDIGSPAVLTDLARGIGLAPDRLEAALEDGTYLERVLGQEQLARSLGVTAVPAAFVGDDLSVAEPVVGAVPYDWMQAAVERALAGGSLEWRRRALRNAVPLEPRRD